jgi:hypothetical protein
MIECRFVSHERQTAFWGLCALGHENGHYWAL